VGQEGQITRFRPSDTVDFVIVGSGAAGGIIAKELATAGYSVVVLEQGPRLTEPLRSDDSTFMQSRTPTTRRRSRIRFEPRRARAQKAWRSSTAGWRRQQCSFTGNFWRLRPSDFNEASVIGGVPGTGFVDWPITYEELEPYYTKAEWELGVSGEPGPFDPARSRPYPMPSLPVKSSGVLLERGARALGLHPQPTPMAINSQFYNGRPACQHCGFCLLFMCEFGSKSTSMAVMLPLAESTGRCEIRPDSYVAQIEVGRNGRATGVRGASVRCMAIWVSAVMVHRPAFRVIGVCCAKLHHSNILLGAAVNIWLCTCR
jgi:choline dehydrogenase-like flavoprotein